MARTPVLSIALLLLVGCASAGSGTFEDALHSDGPAPDRADPMQLYAFLVGDWDTDLVAYAPDGTRHTSRGEIHAGWVLEGRATLDSARLRLAARGGARRIKQHSFDHVGAPPLAATRAPAARSIVPERA